MQVAERKVCIKPLKEFALEKLPQNSALREVLLSEKDDLTVDGYLAKLNIWLMLLRRSSEG